MKNYRSPWTFVSPLFVFRTADSFDSRRLTQHSNAFIRRHPGSKLTASDRAFASSGVCCGTRPRLEFPAILATPMSNMSAHMQINAIAGADR
jgi:hypothetical protein